MEDARALLALCVGGLIDKRRHLVEHAGLTWEVDGSSATRRPGLAEVELDSADQAIELPDWVGAEVTDDARYYNVALASHYSQW